MNVVREKKLCDFTLVPSLLWFGSPTQPSSRPLSTLLLPSVVKPEVFLIIYNLRFDRHDFQCSNCVLLQTQTFIYNYHQEMTFSQRTNEYERVLLVRAKKFFRSAFFIRENILLREKPRANSLAYYSIQRNLEFFSRGTFSSKKKTTQDHKANSKRERSPHHHHHHHHVRN